MLVGSAVVLPAIVILYIERVQEVNMVRGHLKDAKRNEKFWKDLLEKEYAIRIKKNKINAKLYKERRELLIELFFYRKNLLKKSS